MAAVTEVLDSVPSFLKNGGEAGSLLRGHDWAASALGEPSGWPKTLQATLRILLTTPQPMAVLWGKELICFANDALCSWASLGRHQRGIGLPARMVWQRNWPLLRPDIDRVMMGQGPVKRENQQFVRSEVTGESAHWTYNCSAIDGELEDQIGGVLLIATDITDYVVADQRHVRELERQRLLFQQMPGFVAVLRGSEHVFEYVNDAYIAIGGGRDYLGRNVRAVFPELDGQGYYERLDHVYTTGQAFSVRAAAIKLEGDPAERFIDLLYQPIFDRTEAVNGIFVGGYDVTERVRAERALGASEERLQIALEAADLVPWSIDLTTASTPRVAGPDLLLDEADIFSRFGQAGRHVLDEDGVTFKAAFAQALTTGTLFCQLRVLGPNGDVRWIAPQGRTYYNDQGQPVRMTGVVADVTKRKAAEAALHASDARYRTFIETVDVGFCFIEPRFDLSGRCVDYLILETNSAFERQTGVDALGRWASDFVPNLEQHWFDIYGQVAQTGEPAHFENEARVFGRWYDVHALRVEGAGAPKVAVFFNDITSRRQAERDKAMLLELSDRLRDVTDPSEIAFVASEILGKALGVSRVGYGVVDRIAETVTIERDWNAPGIKTLAGMLHFREYGSYIDDLKRGETAVVIDADTDPRTTSTAEALKAISAQGFVNMPLIEQGQFVAIFYANNATARAWPEADLIVMREVAERVRSATERTYAERARRESESQFEVFAQAVPNQVWASNAGGDLYWFNDQLSTYSGEAAGSLGGEQAWFRIVHPDDQPTAMRDWSNALSTGTVFETECRIRRADGVYRWFLARARPVLSETGDIKRWVGTNTDIHDHKSVQDDLARLNETLEDQVAARTADLMLTEEALRQAQKMEAVGQLTGGIAHDFNNLLTGISGSLERIQTRIAQGRLTELDRFIVAAQGASKRAAALTHRLLAFSRRQTLDPKPTDVAALVNGISDLIRRTVGPAIVVDTVNTVGLWATLVDPNQLENALLNLAINGRDAMPDGGRLTIETANKWMDERLARERGVAPGQYLSICVSDTGTGMTPDVIAKAFDPFFTTKPLGEGTGLGLSMIYGFVRQSGGQVRIYSEPDQGTLVCMYLPRYYGDVQPDLGLDPLPELDRATMGETVLVIDDEAAVRMLITDVLSDLDYHAIEAADGPAGLKVLQTDLKIDLLITDVGLPGGMNGRQVADAARELRPDLKILFVTGYAENAAVGNGHLAPGMEVLTKPFGIDDLATRIRKLIEQR